MRRTVVLSVRSSIRFFINQKGSHSMAGTNRLPLHSLRARMIGTVILAWLVPALILTHYIMTLLPSLQELSRDSLTDSADDAWAQVSENMDSLITLSRAATYDGELLSAHIQRAQGTLSDAEFVRRSRNYLERRFAREPLCRCAIYMPDEAAGLMLYDRSGADTADAYRTLAEEAIQAMRAEMDTRCLFYPVQDHLYLARNLLDAQMRSFGLLVLEVDAARLQKPLTEVAAQWEGEQRLAIGAETENTVLPAEKLKNGAGETLVLTEASDSRDWSMIWELTIPREKVYGRVRQFRRVLIGLYLLLIPFLILIAWYIDRRFTRPISRLVDASRKIEQGEFGVTVPMKGEDELGVLGRTFSDMSTHLKELVDRTYKEEIALRDAQIQALQSRINPHFINNALEDINWQARIDGSENVSRMVSALSVLLNASMASRGKRLVTLREEMEVADAYICFIRERFGDRLILRREADQALMDCLLPLLTLQPVLENAVEHGIAPAGSGEIDVIVRKEQGIMRMDVANTGRPIRPEDRQRIDAALNGDQTGSHVGLSNIASRLRLIYQGAASVEVFSEGAKTIVRLRIPMHTEKEKTT